MEEQTIITKKERANSYEFGKAHNRFKLYFDNAEELKVLVNSLKEFIEEEQW